MDLKQLKYYVTIVEEGSISAASKKLFLSQPPLSKQIQSLEEELDTTLFKRGTKRISLTDSGLILYSRAKTLLSLSYSIKEEIEELKDGNRGTIRIGVVSSTASFFINNFMKDFMNEYPNIRFDITEKNTYELLSSIKKGELEVAIVRSPFETDLAKIEIKKEPLIAFGQQNFFKYDLQTSLSEITASKYAVYTRWLKVIEPYFTKAKIGFKPNIIHSDARTGISFAKACLGIAILPLSSVDIRDYQMVRRINDLNLETEITLVYNESTFKSEALSLFISFVENKKVLL